MGRQILTTYENKILDTRDSNEYTCWDEYEEVVSNLSPDTPEGVTVTLITSGGHTLANHRVEPI